MDVKLLKLDTTYVGKYGPARHITRLSKTHLYYIEAGSTEEQKTQNEKFAKWATAIVPDVSTREGCEKLIANTLDRVEPYPVDFTPIRVGAPINEAAGS